MNRNYDTVTEDDETLGGFCPYYDDDAPLIGQTTAADPMANRVIDVLFREMRQDENTLDRAELAIDGEFQRLGPYGFAKQHGLLVDGSGEEAAMAWMAYANANSLSRY